MKSDHDLTAQVVHVMENDPESQKRLLALARYSAEELCPLTKAENIQRAYQKARMILAQNSVPFVKEQRYRPVIYSGGLPGLGKRR